MNRQEILARLRAHEAELRAQGVTHAALFGSHARGEATADSDTDIMIEIDPTPRSASTNMSGSRNTSPA